MASEPSNLTPTLGAYEIGVLISIFLFGLVTVQTFTYYKKFPKDPWYLRLYVGALWLTELAHTMLSAHSLYYNTIIHYGQEESIFVFPPTLIGAVGLSGVIGPAVQAFFANRIRILSSKWIIPCICWILSFLRFVSVLAVVGAACRTNTVIGFREKWLWLLVTSLAISAAVDVLIAASLCYYLWDRRQVALDSTKRVVDKLIVWTIQTGLLTSLATTTMLITFIVLDDFTWMAIIFVICRLFSNSLMASLNARATLRNINNKVNFIGDSNFHLQSTAPSNDINVAMTKVTERWDSDMETAKSRVNSDSSIIQP